MDFLIKVLVVAGVSFSLAYLMTGISIDSFVTALIFSLVLALLNVFLKPLLVILTLPVTILTLGLFLFILNTLVVLLASRFVTGISIANFWWGFLFSLLLTLSASLLDKMLKKKNMFGF